MRKPKCMKEYNIYFCANCNEYIKDKVKCNKENCDFFNVDLNSKK